MRSKREGAEKGKARKNWFILFPLPSILPSHGMIELARIPSKLNSQVPLHHLLSVLSLKKAFRLDLNSRENAISFVYTTRNSMIVPLRSYYSSSASTWNCSSNADKALEKSNRARALLWLIQSIRYNLVECRGSGFVIVFESWSTNAQCWYQIF